jgi:hypothetical protein
VGAVERPQVRTAQPRLLPGADLMNPFRP